MNDTSPTEDEPESDRERITTNVVILVFLAILIGAGVWLANALVSLRKNQDCVLSGRRNCAEISVPARER